MTSLAVVSPQGQILVVPLEGGPPRSLTGVAPGLGPWAPPDTRFAWPVFSPDGRRIATTCGAPDDDDAPAAVEIHDVDGVGAVRVLERGAGAPIHARWSPDGGWLAVLLQVEDRLELVVVPTDAPGRPRLVEEGVPLFYAWMPDSRRLVVHAGSGDGRPGRVVVRAAVGGEPDAVLPFPAGRFCTPVVAGGDVVVAMGGRGGSAVVRFQVEEERVQPLFAAPGLQAFLRSPDGAALAVAPAGAAERPPYAGVFRVTLATGEVTPLARGPVDAFTWLPGGRGLLVARRDVAGGRVTWSRCDADGERRVGALRPTPDQSFHLHFFEQFDSSHPLVDPTGRWLVQARWSALGGGRSEVVCFDLADPGAPPHVVGEGRYGVFPPAPPAPA